MIDKYRHMWEEALQLWSKYLKLSFPLLCTSLQDETEAGLAGSFAMIRLADHTVVISLRIVEKLKIEKYLPAIMAHEIGHHIYCPGDLADQGRMIARMRRGLPGKEHQAPFIANLYSDLLINDRLKRDFGQHIDRVYQAMGDDAQDKMWNFYMRIYEILWALPKGTLAKRPIDAIMEGDAQLGNRLVRSFARDWLKGAGRFAALCLPYLLQNDGQEMQRIYSVWTDAKEIGKGGSCPDGLSTVEDDEISGARHPALDDQDAEVQGNRTEPIETDGRQSPSSGQYREPFEYGQILKAMGMSLERDEILHKYYKERAMPHLISFPQKVMPQSLEPLPEGMELWDPGSPPERIDWFETMARSPYVIPGYTTLERSYGTTEGHLPAKKPIDLDIYVDSSGSMPNPGYQTSYLALAGAIIALSALRTGAQVQVTLWSGTNQFLKTDGFTSNEKEIMAVLTGFFGGATAFPIHILRDTYRDRPKGSPDVHILVISDEGVTTIYNKDEQGNDGYQVAKTALEKAGAGGTFVLNLWQGWEKYGGLKRAAKQGWDIYPISNWQELLEFADRFSRKRYGSKHD